MLYVIFATRGQGATRIHAQGRGKSLEQASRAFYDAIDEAMNVFMGREEYDAIHEGFEKHGMLKALRDAGFDASIL